MEKTKQASIAHPTLNKCYIPGGYPSILEKVKKEKNIPWSQKESLEDSNLLSFALSLIF